MIKNIWTLVLFLLLPLQGYAMSTSTCVDTDTKLLLHANGSEAATTFIDSSTGANTITTNGDANINTSKFNNAGFFDGTGDYLTVPTNTDWNFGTGDFTIDFWVRFASTTGGQGLIGRGATGTYIDIYKSSGGVLFYYIGGVEQLGSYAWNPSANTWYHLAFIRSGTSTKAFVNGTQVGSTGTNSANITSSNDFTIARQESGLVLNGWMDEVRIVKGVAVWTANFTPSTSEYTSDANTKLLLHMNGGLNSTTFTDSGNTGHTITAVADAKQAGVTVFNSGSIRLDGTGDYITAADSTDWDFGTADLTIDFWAKFNTVGSATFFDKGGVHTGGYLMYYAAGGSSIQLYFSNSLIMTRSWSPLANTWYHLALTRSGTNLRLFIDGTQQGVTVTNSTDLSGSTDVFAVGYDVTESFAFLNGWIDEFRVVKGTAVWITDFTSPTIEYSTCSTRRRLTSCVGQE